MKRSLAILLFVSSLLVVSCGQSKTPDQNAPAQQATLYQCPMKCEGDTKTYDKPGKCPVCGMDLKPVEAATPADTSGHAVDSTRAV